MIGALPTTYAPLRKCLKCEVSGHMYACWVCGDMAELVKGEYNGPGRGSWTPWVYSETKMEHLGPPPPKLVEGLLP